MNIDEMIEEHEKALEDAWRSHDNVAAKLFNETLTLFKELKQRRESALRPADKYLTNTPEQQFEHVKSEIVEIEAEFKIGNTINLAMEIVDLQMSAETLLTVLPLDEKGRNAVRRLVIIKNAARSYYEK